MRSLLNPCDYFLLMIDEAMRRDGLPGNSCVAFLRMDDVPSSEELQKAVCDPALNARLRFSPFRRRPFWESDAGSGIPVREGGDLESILNGGGDPRRDPPFELFRMPEGVAVRWHHALMDAKGAEALLTGKTSDIPRGREYDPDLKRHGWWKRIRMSMRARRRLREMDASGVGPGSKRFRVKLDSFDASEVLGRAASLCGPLQKHLYFLAATFRALDAVVTAPGPLVIPLSATLRKRGWSPVIANYLTFFHLALERGTGDMPEIVRRLKQSQMEQIRNRDDEAMVALLHLGRRLSLRRYARERQPATAWFSFSGETQVTEFLGRPVREYRSFPAVPTRPGVGVFFNLAAGRVFLTTVYTCENVDRFVHVLRETL